MPPVKFDISKLSRELLEKIHRDVTTNQEKRKSRKVRGA